MTAGTLLTLKEAGAYTGRSEHFIRDLIAAGEIDARKRTPRGRWLISRTSIDQWIRNGRPDPNVTPIAVPPMRWTSDAA